MTIGAKKFSNKNRLSRLEEISKTQYDLIIIGGGITGAGIALDASLRGLKTILLEKKDFASGTSSKSTKLIHGGLRYLKQLEISLVRESGLERSIAHNNICHLVHPENMFLPIVEKGTFSKLTAGIAISVYDWLASVPKKDKKRMLNKAEALKTEPLLRESILKSGIVYSEYRTDDARLTVELIKAARRHGAEAFNYMEVEAFVKEKGTVIGVQVKDKILDRSIDLRGTIVVNATGPWVDGLRQIDDPNSETNLRGTKGVHIVLSKQKLPLSNSTYFDAFDGRMIFAIPRGNSVYAGTTDTNYTGNKDDLRCTCEDAEYLLNAINNFFNINPLELKDIDSTWAGLRPLIQQTGKPPTEVSRRDEIFVSKNGLVSIAGGKLTGFRKMAERVLNLVYERMGKKSMASPTVDFKIHNQPFKSYSDFIAFTEKLSNTYKSYHLAPDAILEMASNFGNDLSKILEDAELSTGESAMQCEKKILLSQVNYSLEYESIYHPMDFLERRTGWLYFNVEKAKQNIDTVANHICSELGLSESQRKVMIAESQETLRVASLEEVKQQQVST